MKPFHLGQSVRVGVATPFGVSKLAVVGLWQPGRRFVVANQGLVATCGRDGFRMVNPHYLREDVKFKPPSHLVRMAFSVDDMVDQGFSLRAAPGELVHRATKDLWGFEQTEEGMVLCRLFDPTGNPLKV